MSLGHKLLIGLGAAVIVGMLVVAAFALGVYVGEHGWTREGLTLTGPGGPGQPPPDRQPPLGGQPLPGGGRPDIVGRVEDIFDDTLFLATSQGPRTVELSNETRVETEEGQEAGRDDIERGVHMAVFGHLGGDGRVLVADLIVLLPPPGGPPPQQPLPQP